MSTPYTAETVESAQALLVVGPLFNDYNTVGFTSLLTPGERSLLSKRSRVQGAGCLWAPLGAWAINALQRGSFSGQ